MSSHIRHIGLLFSYIPINVKERRDYTS